MHQMSSRCLSSISHSAPVFTKEDEERELAELTSEDKEKILADLMGASADGLSLDDDDVSVSLLEEFEKEMDKIPPEEKVIYNEAKEHCPLVVSAESDPVRFLRANKYDPKAAAKQMVLYWEKRVDFFGKENAFLPMTLTGALRDDLEIVREISRYCTILPPDKHGRTVIAIDGTCADVTQYDKICIIRFIWYVYHVALENKSTQIKGVVALQVWTRSTVTRFNRIRNKLLIHSLRYWLPVSIKCFQTVTRKTSTARLAPVMLFFIGPALRQRVVIHFIEQGLSPVLDALETYGLHRDDLPKSIGGKFVSNSRWIQDRLDAETVVNEPTPVYNYGFLFAQS